jgi:hypothetical protein
MDFCLQELKALFKKLKLGAWITWNSFSQKHLSEQMWHTFILTSQDSARTAVPAPHISDPTDAHCGW